MKYILILIIALLMTSCSTTYTYSYTKVDINPPTHGDRVRAMIDSTRTNQSPTKAVCIDRDRDGNVILVTSK